MLIQCPQCQAELAAESKECFACGCILEEWVALSATPSSETPDVHFIGKAVSQAPTSFSLGVTLKGRYTIRQPRGRMGLWALYEVIDQQQGGMSLLQIASQKHPMAESVVQRVKEVLSTAHFPQVLDTGVEPAAFFVYSPLEGQTLRQWKKDHRGLEQRIDMCTQMLEALDIWSRNGFEIGAFDSEQIFIEQNQLRLHPILLSMKKQDQRQSALEWMYGMLSLQSVSFTGSHFPLEGLSIRYAQWIHLMLRRKSTFSAMLASWTAHIAPRFGRAPQRCAEQLRSQLLEDEVGTDFELQYAIDLEYVVQESMIFGSHRCVKGKVMGYVDRVLLAYEGLFFAPEVVPLQLWYQQVVLDQDVAFPAVDPNDFEALMIQTKIDFLLARDWERMLTLLLARASDFSEWMEINRFRIMFGVQPEKIVVPKPSTVDENIQLASFFYWFCDDVEEARLWYDEAQKLVSDAYDAFQICEAEVALFSKIQPQSLERLRALGKESAIPDQLILLEELEDRLGFSDEEWLQSFALDNTAERILWCRSRFTTETDIADFNRYCQSIRNQLCGFGFVFEKDPSWDHVEEEERALQAQLKYLLQINQQNLQYEALDFPIPPITPPFSQNYIDQRERYLASLVKSRKLEQATIQNKLARRDGIVIFLLVLIVAIFIGAQWLP